MTRPDCGLSHHRPGRHVRWQKWDTLEHRIKTFAGVVVDHRADMRFITLASVDGTVTKMPCGSVGRWPR